MFTFIVGGPIDPIVAGLAMAVMFITFCIFFTSFVLRHRTHTELKMQFELDKTKLHNEDADKKRQNDRLLEYDMAKLATERDVQFRRIETGLIEGKVNKSTTRG